MAKWSVEQTHEWLMKTLYEKYLEDEQASIRWSETLALEASESHPQGDDIIQANKQLASLGWVEILTQAYGYLFARMTPAGRDAWEALLKERESNPVAVLPSQ